MGMEEEDLSGLDDESSEDTHNLQPRQFGGHLAIGKFDKSEPFRVMNAVAVRRS